MKFAKIVLLLLLFAPFAGNAQCRAYTKKVCRPQLNPYIHNGQMNSAILYPADKADIMLTFYSGQSYRLIVCSEEQLGDVKFKVMTTDKKVIYQSDGSKNTFDFKVASTQQLIVTVEVPEGENTHEIEFNGCVSVLVGFANE